MISLEEDRMNLVALAIDIVVAAVATYLLLTPRAWFCHHPPLPLHSASSRPGTVPRMAHGQRLRAW